MIAVAIDILTGIFECRAKKKYHLTEDETGDPILRQALCYMPARKKSGQLALTSRGLMIYEITRQGRTSLLNISRDEIKQCRRNFWSQLVIETFKHTFVLTVENPKQWIKEIKKSNKC